MHTCNRCKQDTAAIQAVNNGTHEMSPNRQASHYLDFDSDRRHQSRLIYNAVFPVNFQEQPPRNDAGEFLRDRSFFRPEYYIIHKSGYQNNQT